MGYFVSALVAALCLYLIIRPFFNKESNWQINEIRDDLDRISLDQIYATLNEVEMEYNMGKLPEDEYVKVKNQYELMAVEKIKDTTAQEDGTKKSN